MAVRVPDSRLVALVAILAGAGLGTATACLQAALRPWQIGGFRPVDSRTEAHAPRAEIDQTVHAFGSIATGATGSHVFTIRNTGPFPLTLSRGASSCSCTIGELGSPAGGDPTATGTNGRTVVPPGSSAPVTVQWKGKGDGGSFRQQVTILTDDPRRPEIPLVVEGTVIPNWRAVPEAIVLTGLVSGTGVRAGATIFTFGDRPPRDISVSVDGEPDETVRVSTAAAEKAAVDAEPRATGGFRVDVEIPAGLPPGRLRRTITATFDMDGERFATIPLDVTVNSDLSLAGAAWDSDRHMLILGTVSSRAGLKTQLFITARGPHAAGVRPVVREVTPAGLAVTVGEPRPVGSGGSLRIPLDVAILPGSKPANHLCSQSGKPGTIVLDTGHPSTPTLTIPVCVAIGP